MYVIIKAAVAVLSCLVFCVVVATTDMINKRSSEAEASSISSDVYLLRTTNGKFEIPVYCVEGYEWYCFNSGFQQRFIKVGVKNQPVECESK